MSNEIQIKISSVADVSGAQKAERAIHDVETQADKAGNAVGKLDRDIRALKDKKVKVDVDVGKAGPIGGLDDKSVKVKVEPDKASASSFAKKFGGLAMPDLSAVGGSLGKVFGNQFGIAAGAAVTPLLVSGLASALSGSLGAGVIGVGVAAAVAGDKGLQSAGKQAGKKFFDSMTAEAKVLNGPVRESIFILGEAGERIAHKWGTAFKDIQDDVVPLVRNLVVGFERISDAVTDAVADNGPAIDAMGVAWRLVADGVGDFVDTLSDGGGEAADNLVIIGGVVHDVVDGLGDILDVANELGKLNPLSFIMPDMAEHYRDVAGEVGTFSKHVKGSATAMEDAAAAADGERAALEGLASELKAQADPVFAILKAQRDLADAQDDTAKATKKHGKNSKEAEEALQKQALAALSLESNIGKLGETFDGHLTPSMRATLRAAKLSDSAIDGLEKQFMAAKRAGDRFDGKYKATVSAPGAKKAQQDLWRVKMTADSIPDVVRIAMKVTGVSNVSAAAAAVRKNMAHGGISGAANGATSSGLTWVGENGPELMDIAPGSRVHSNPDSMRIAGNNGGGGGGGPITVNLILDGKVVASSVVEPLRGMVNRQGSGSAQKFFGDARVAA